MSRSGRRTPPLMQAQRMANANAEGDASFLAQLLAVRQSGGGAGVGGVFERINGLEEAVTILQSDMVDAKKQLLEMTLSLENIKRDNDNPKLDLEMQELRQRVHGLETQLDTWGHFEDESIRSIPDQLEGLGDCDINDGDRIASTEDIYTAEMGSEAKKDDTEVTGANKGEPDTEEKFSAILKRPMTEKSKKVLVDCIGLLGNHPDLNSVIGVLFENSILSSSELMRLESVQTTAEQSKILLTKILPAKAEGAFWGFRKALASLPHTEFLIGILDDKLRCIFLELTAEVKRAFGRSVRNAPAASQEIHQQLQKLTPELVQVMEHLGLIVSRIRPGSIKIDLVFWNIEQLDRFWTWLHSRQRSPLSDALSRVILTDEVRGLVPDDELVVMLSSSLDWNGYMAARKRLLADTLSKVARDDLYFECQKLHTEVKISPYLTVFGDVTRYSDVSPKDLVRLACANGYPDLIPRLQSNFPLELSDFTAKDVRLERARELARIREKMHRVKVSKLIDRIGKKDAEISSLEGELKEVRLKCISLEVALEDQSDRGLRTVLENKNAEIARIKKMYDEEKKKATKLESDLDLANKEKAGLMKQLHSKSIGFQTDRANQPNVLVGKAPLQDEEQILVNFNEEALQDVGRSREGLGRKQSREQLTNIAKGEVTSEYPHASSNIDDPREDSKSPQAEASLSQNEQPLTAQAEKTTAPLTATQNRGRNVVRPDGRSNGLDTVLLLDTSGSMAGEAFDQMIQAVKSILDNMEYSADIYGFTENVSLITVGGYRQSRVLVSLSCDYQRARRILETLKSEGMSPLAPAIQEAQREIQRNGASLHVSGRKVAPRIYVFTDGIPSDEDEYRTSDLTEGNMAAKYKTMTAVQVYQDGDHRNKAEISFVGCGSKVDTIFLESASKIGKGKYMRADDPEAVDRIGGYYRRVVWVYRFAAPFRDTSTMKQLAAQDKETFRNWLTATKSGEINQKDLSEFDVNEMYSMLVALATEKRATERYDGSDTDSDPSLKVELPLGSRVRRGPDWAGQSEDADGPGTVVEHQKGRKVLVKWDYTDGIGVYRFGENNCYDVLPTDEPRILRADQLIDVGVKVVRGPDWEWGDQDGGEGNVGTVYKVEQRGAVWVQWPNGSYNMYRYGHEGLIDLTIVDVVSSDNNVQPKTLANDGGMPNTSQENGHAWWQWNRNGSWVLYPVNVNMRLEQEYQANPRSGVEVEIDSVRRYVDFQNLKDLCMDTGEEFEIQRSVFTEDEYVAALSTT